MFKKKIYRRYNVSNEIAKDVICRLFKENFVEFTIKENVIASSYIPIIFSTFDKRLFSPGKRILNPFIHISKVVIMLPTKQEEETIIHIDASRAFIITFLFIFIGVLVLITDPRMSVFLFIVWIIFYLFEVEHIAFKQTLLFIDNAFRDKRGT